MTREISNSEDVMDSRDVMERLDELEMERQDLVDAVQSAGEAEDFESSKVSLELWDEDYGDELKSLKSLAEEGENLTREWRDGTTLIRESYWVEYVEDLCKDIGDMPREIPHYIVIDWESTADNIAVDYSTLDFDGVTYYIRSC